MVGKDEVELVAGRRPRSRGSRRRPAASPACRSVYTRAARLRAATRSTSRASRRWPGGRSARRCSRSRTRRSSGCCRRAGTPRSTRRWTRVIGAGDKLIAIAADDDTIRARPRRPIEPDAADHRRGSRRRAHARADARSWAGTGARRRSSRSSTSYVAPGSEVTVVADARPRPATIERRCARSSSRTRRSTFQRRRHHRPRGRSTRSTSATYDHVDRARLLGWPRPAAGRRADARHAAPPARHRGTRPATRFSIVSEMLDVRNRDAGRGDARRTTSSSATGWSACTSPRSPRTSSSPPCFADLFDAEGSEIYLKPAADYVVRTAPSRLLHGRRGRAAARRGRHRLPTTRAGQ